MWRYHAGESVSHIARVLKTTRVSVLTWIDRALQMGVEAGMKDTPHKPREAVSRTMPRPGWFPWVVPNPRTLATPPNCGRGRRWRSMSANMPFRRAIRLWPARPRPPFTVSWPRRSRKVDHLCSFRVDHTENRLCHVAGCAVGHIIADEARKSHISYCQLCGIIIRRRMPRGVASRNALQSGGQRGSRLVSRAG